MSKMSDLDLMVREGERTAEDFIRRGYDARTARAMADVVEASNNVVPEGKLSGDELANVWAREQLAAARPRLDEVRRELRALDGEDVSQDTDLRALTDAWNAEDSAPGHGPGCFGECDGFYDCSGEPIE